MTALRSEAAQNKHHLDNTSSSDPHHALRPTRLGAERLNLLHDVLARDHLPKDDVFPIKPPSRSSSDEELRSVGVLT